MRKAAVLYLGFVLALAGCWGGSNSSATTSAGAGGSGGAAAPEGLAALSQETADFVTSIASQETFKGLQLSSSPSAALTAKSSFNPSLICQSGFPIDPLACSSGGASILGGQQCSVSLEDSGTFLKLCGTLSFESCGIDCLTLTGGPVSFCANVGPLSSACVTTGSCPDPLPVEIETSLGTGGSLTIDSCRDGSVTVDAFSADFSGTVSASGVPSGSYSHLHFASGTTTCHMEESVLSGPSPVTCTTDT